MTGTMQSAYVLRCWRQVLLPWYEAKVVVRSVGRQCKQGVKNEAFCQVTRRRAWPAGARAGNTVERRRSGRPAPINGRLVPTNKNVAQAKCGRPCQRARRRQTAAQPSAIIAFGWDETSTTNVYPTSLGEPAAVGESPPAGPI